ncbi:hypothetical protein GALL_423500 [mine drainage metagenome]|uniref:Uncharacterized protein n=1 Tax=mine drainage metagenome TaxID=410659 RepID=A0A1J5QEN9_9ZZZZ
MRFLLGNAILGVDHQHHHVGIIDGLHGLDYGEFLDRLEHLAATPHASGVDNGVFLAVAFQIDIDGIARGARFIECNHTLLTQQRIHQRGFAYIGTADDGHLGGTQAGVLNFVRFRFRRKILQRQIDQIPHALAMGG